MSFVERVNARAGACEVLGVGSDASAEELRAAWKRVAFQTHPDRNGGIRTAFDRAKAAYALLSGEHAGACPQPETDRPGIRRPRVMPRLASLSPEAIAACERLLGQPDDVPKAAPEIIDLGIVGRPGFTAGRSTTDHVPSLVEREGCNLSFVIEGALSMGVNRVALPSAEFLDRRKVEPRIVIFTSNRSGAGQVTIPSEMLQRVVPGARSVKIRFIGTDGSETARSQTRA